MIFSADATGGKVATDKIMDTTCSVMHDRENIFMTYLG
jgi:hypothetical protein